jgi:hypothetical protein
MMPQNEPGEVITPKFPGVDVTLGGQVRVVPALSINQVKAWHTRLTKLNLEEADGIPSEESLETIIGVVHAALTRNYSSMTLEEVQDLIDLGNLTELFDAVVGKDRKHQSEAASD